MKSYGNINMLQNQIRNPAVQQVSNFPTTPVLGELVFKDKRFYIAVELITGIATWVPLTNEIDTYVHNQETASSTWTITHNLNTGTPGVQVYDQDTNIQLIADEIEIISNNEVEIRFGSALAGRAVVFWGALAGNGGDPSQINYTHTQSTLATTWTVNHNLGYHPIVRVFVGNEEIQPASIVHDSVFKTTITFSEAKTGIARFV